MGLLWLLRGVVWIADLVIMIMVSFRRIKFNVDNNHTSKGMYIVFKEYSTNTFQKDHPNDWDTCYKVPILGAMAIIITKLVRKFK